MELSQEKLSTIWRRILEIPQMQFPQVDCHLETFEATKLFSNTKRKTGLEIFQIAAWKLYIDSLDRRSKIVLGTSLLYIHLALRRSNKNETFQHFDVGRITQMYPAYRLAESYAVGDCGEVTIGDCGEETIVLISCLYCWWHWQWWWRQLYSWR